MRSGPGDAPDVLDAFEAIPALALAFAGPEHVVVMNAAARAFTGDRHVLGRRVRDAMPEYRGQRLFDLLERVRVTGEPAHAREWRVQVDGGGDGGLEDRFLDFVLAPWRGPDGESRGVVGVGHDVTEAVAARAAAEARPPDARAHADDAELRYRAARTAVEALQNALLPTDLPVLPSVRLAAHYLVADPAHTAGGDWFDAFVLDDGRLALVVGDVVGHGVRASVVMSRLRAVLVELLTHAPDLSGALARLGRFATRVPGAFGASVCVVLLGPDGRCEYATCGHPPPLLVPDGRAGGEDGGRPRYLPPTGGAPLGAGPPVVGHDVLRPGDALMLFSDGLVERADRPLPDGLAELEAVAADAAGTRMSGAPAALPERLCRLSVEVLTRTGHTDDVTGLAAHRLWSAGPPGSRRPPTRPGSRASARS